MTHCNDQLIDQLLTQAEQEGRCLIKPPLLGFLYSLKNSYV